MSFQMAPPILDRIEFWRLGRQRFHHDVPAGRSYVILDQQAEMDGRAVPQDQHFAGNVPLQVLQKLNDLRAFDAALVPLKIEAPQCQAAKGRKTLPVEGFMEDGRLSARGPSAGAGRSGARTAFI